MVASLVLIRAKYPRHSRQALGMVKTCISLRKPEDMPSGLIAELRRQRSVANWAAYSATRPAPSRRPPDQSARQ